MSNTRVPFAPWPPSLRSRRIALTLWNDGEQANSSTTIPSSASWITLNPACSHTGRKPGLSSKLAVRVVEFGRIERDPIFGCAVAFSSWCALESHRCLCVVLIFRALDPDTLMIHLCGKFVDRSYIAIPPPRRRPRLKHADLNAPFYASTIILAWATRGWMLKEASVLLDGCGDNLEEPSRRDGCAPALLFLKCPWSTIGSGPPRPLLAAA